MDSLGRHILVEFSGCSAELMDDVAHIEQSMTQAAKEAGATVIESSFHHFSPYGVSGVVVIQESHLAIHTWPEFQYAAVDLFTCGDTVDPWISFDWLKKAFKATNHNAIEMYRGSLSLLNRCDFKPEAADLKGGADGSAPKKEFQRSLWFTDRDENQALSLRYHGQPLFNKKSEFQRVQVLDTASYGRMLTIDNMVMATERDEFHYHEMIVHPFMQLLEAPKNALIIGGGDGGTARELLKYASLEKVTMVEIDGTVVEASKKFLPQMSSQLDHPKLDLKIGDGIDYVKTMAAEQPESFDLIIVDGSDPKGPAQGLFSDEFFADCRKALKPGGAVCTQAESPMFQKDAFVDVHRCFSELFGADQALTYLFFASTYPSGMWSIQGAFKDRKVDPVADLNTEKADAFASEQSLKYYNSEVHRGAFALPTFVQEMLSL